MRSADPDFVADYFAERDPLLLAAADRVAQSLRDSIASAVLQSLADAVADDPLPIRFVRADHAAD